MARILPGGPDKNAAKSPPEPTGGYVQAANSLVTGVSSWEGAGNRAGQLSLLDAPPTRSPWRQRRLGVLGRLPAKGLSP